MMIAERSDSRYSPSTQDRALPTEQRAVGVGPGAPSEHSSAAVVFPDYGSVRGERSSLEAPPGMEPAPRGAIDATLPLTAVLGITAGGGVSDDDLRDAPLRGDMAPRSDPADTAAASGGVPQPPPPPGQAPLVSSGQHQTHNLSQALLHLSGLVGALPQWPLQPHQLSEDHIRLAGLLAASYTLGRDSCRKPTLPSAPVTAWAPAPVPALSAVVSEEEQAAALLSGRSAIQTSHQTLGRPFDRISSLVLDRMANLTDDHQWSAVSVPAGHLTAMQLVEDIMVRQRDALGVLYSQQRQQMDERMKQQREAIQRTFNVELKYVAKILTAIGAQGQDQVPPRGEEGGEVDYGDGDAKEDDSTTEVDYRDTDVEEPLPTLLTVNPEKVDGDSVTGTTPATVDPQVGTFSTPFARAPQTTESPACQPFDENTAREALTRDSRVLMDILFGIGLEFFRAVRPDEGPVVRSALPEPRTVHARSRVGRQMTRLVRTVAGSAVRFQFSLSLLEKHREVLERLQELLRAGADRPQGPGSTEYNLTMAVTALTSCFIDGVPGFRMVEALDGRTTFFPLKQESSRPQVRDSSESSMALRFSTVVERVWSLCRFLFNTFIQPASTVQLRTDQNLRVVSLRRSELRQELLRAISGLTPAQQAELQELVAALAADDSELQHAVSELRQLMGFFANISGILLTSGADGGGQAIEAGPSAVIRHVGDALLRSLGCFSSSLAGTWAPSPSSDSAPTPPPTPPTPVTRPVCQSLEETAEAILDNMPVLAEMLYKIGLKFTDAFSVEPEPRVTEAAAARLTAVSPASPQIERLVRIVAGSTGRFRPPLAAAEEYISLLDRLRGLLEVGAATAGGRPGGEVREDHNLTLAVSRMTACFVQNVPGFELEESAGAKSAFSVVTEMEEVYIQVKNALPDEPSVAMRFSIIMVRIWTNWIFVFNNFVKPSTDVRLQQSTNVRVLSLREPVLRDALLSTIAALSSQQLSELRQLCAQLATEDGQLQPAADELRHLMTYLAGITDQLLTTRAVRGQTIAAGPSAVIRHMGHALLQSLGCFSAALSGSETTDAWSTPSPPTAPPPPVVGDDGGESPQCQLLEEANSNPRILDDLEVWMKDFFDMGLTFFSLFKPDPVFASPSLPESRSATGQAPASRRISWLLRSVRRSAGRFQFPLDVAERYSIKLERLWSLLAAGAAGSPLGEVQSDHNLTEAVSALTVCFVQHVPGYHLEETLTAKSTDGGTFVFPPPEPPKRRAGDSDSVTLRVADVMARVWLIWRSMFGMFVRPASSIQLYPEKNVRVLSLSRPRLQASLLAAVSALDVLQRAELEKVCRELAAAELRFSVSELQQLMTPLAELSELRLTKAAPLARQQQQTATAGPVAIVVRMSRALPHSLGCFLAALAGRRVAESGLPQEATEIPATVLPGALPKPGLPQSGDQPAADAPTSAPSVATASPPPQPPQTSPPEQTTTAANDIEDIEDIEQGDPFLAEQDVDVVNDILAGLG